MSLNAKQRKFIDAYLVSFHATEAAIAAGYSEKTAYSIGSRLLKNPEIQEAIDLILDELHKKQKKVLVCAAEHAIAALLDTIQHGRGLARVQASNSVLDRSGHKPIDKVQTDMTANITAEMSVEDARIELADKFDRRYPISDGETGANNEPNTGSSENPSQ